jgi:hypothetical protein
MDAEIKGNRAAVILNDDTFKLAVDGVLSYHIGIFTNASSSQDEIMEAHRMVRSLALIEGQLQSFIDDGEIQKRKKTR